MLNRRNNIRNGHDWNAMPDMELESLSGVRIFGRVFAKRGVGRTPRNPTCYGPDAATSRVFESSKKLIYVYRKEYRVKNPPCFARFVVET